MSPEAAREALEICLDIEAKLEKMQYDITDIRDCLIRMELIDDAARRRRHGQGKQS